MPLLLIFAPIILVVFWVISVYNFFVSSKARIAASIQEIGNQLKRQAELIPNLESSAKGFLSHEKEIFKLLVSARKQVVEAAGSGDVELMNSASDALNKVIPRLSIAVEDNPEVSSSSVVSKLMDELRDTSDKVMYARRLLIDLSADYNTRLVTFPDNIVAKFFKFETQKGLSTPEKGSHIEVSESDVKTPKISI
jgi:LemA protein